MAKTKAKAKDEGNANKIIYVVLFATTLLVVAALFMSVQEDNLTAWATVHSNDLKFFLQICRENSGTMDVAPSNAGISFLCTYSDGATDSYVLSPKK
jgi:hypothetical protein